LSDCLSGDLSNSKYLPQSDSSTRTRSNLPEPPSERDVPDSLTEHVLAVAAPSVVLSEEQRTVLEMVQRGENVFFTGSAGRKHGFFSPVGGLNFCRDRKVRSAPRHH